MPTVSRFNVTPVKSTRLHHPERVRLEPHGVPGDREFFFIDEDGRLIGGSKHGPLVQIESAYDAERDTLGMRFPDGIQVDAPAGRNGDAVIVDFYGRPVSAHVIDGPWTEYLSHLAGRDLRLARVDRPGDGIDVWPITLVSLASVEELARKGGDGDGLDPRRFRMTLEIEGLAPHEEDSWDGRRVRVGEAVLRVETPVPRCVVTTQDPATGLRDFPTLQVIKRYRGERNGKMIFGMYASVLEPGEARTGDPVEPLT